jgi:predicted Rossmann-fold nucleotide-binding protein
VVGIIPQALVDKEWAKRDCTELHIVDTMHERKRLMAERADAFLALAGGIGTFEELFEVWTWRQLGYHDKPVGILDTAGYYQALLAFLAKRAQGLHERLADGAGAQWAPSPPHCWKRSSRSAGRTAAGDFSPGPSALSRAAQTADSSVSPVRMRTTRSTW